MVIKFITINVINIRSWLIAVHHPYKPMNSIKFVLNPNANITIANY